MLHAARPLPSWLIFDVGQAMKAEPPFKCPACMRALYDRKRKTCGYCGASIPEEVRFLKEMIADLEGGKFTDKDNLDWPHGDSNGV